MINFYFIISNFLHIIKNIQCALLMGRDQAWHM